MQGVRRAELEQLSIQLPVLATVALGGLPGPAEWASRLFSIGLDVISSGAAHDTPETYAAARAAVEYRPVKATDPIDVEGVIAAGARLIETTRVLPSGVYRLSPDEAMIVVVDGTSPEIEDANVVARTIVNAALETAPSALWVVSSPGLDQFSEYVAEQKLRALCECAYRARLVFAKEQFD